jgi:integration host factor subunit alpha
MGWWLMSSPRCAGSTARKYGRDPGLGRFPQVWPWCDMGSFWGKRMALTKAEMAERLFDEVGLNKREAKEFVDAFFDVLREALEQGRQVKLSGFGNFDLRRKNQRPGRNPKTGEEIPISARTVVTFRPGQKLKERVEAYSGGITDA